MKKVFLFLLCVVLMAGCAADHQELERVMAFRASLLGAMGCQFQVTVTADYQDSLQTFGMNCQANGQGTLEFEVTQPDSISGISGVISAEGGKLTFDDQALAFELLADGQIAPVTAPWLLIKTLRGGYITSCGKADDMIRISVNDSFEDDALQLDIWFDGNCVPQYAEILWDDRRILSLEIGKFQIL